MPILGNCPTIFFNIYYNPRMIDSDKMTKSIRNIKKFFNYLYLPVEIRKYIDILLLNRDLDYYDMDTIIYNIALLITLQQCIDDELDHVVILPGTAIHKYPDMGTNMIPKCDMLFISPTIFWNPRKPYIVSNDAIYFNKNEILIEFYNLTISSACIMRLKPSPSPEPPLCSSTFQPAHERNG